MTCSFPGKSTHGSAEQVVDGKTDSHFGYGRPGEAWVQVDLKATVELTQLKVWHYFRDRRAYDGNRIAVSETGAFAGEELVVYDSDLDGTYRETADGKAFCFEPVRARHIRNWLDGNSANATSQWIESQAFGR